MNDEILIVLFNTVQTCFYELRNIHYEDFYIKIIVVTPVVKLIHILRHWLLCLNRGVKIAKSIHFLHSSDFI